MIGKKINGVELGRPGSTPLQIRNEGLSEAGNKERLGDTQKESASEKRDNLLETIRKKTAGNSLTPVSNLSMPIKNFKVNGGVSREGTFSADKQSSNTLGKTQHFFEKAGKTHEETNLIANRSRVDPLVGPDTDVGRKAAAIQKSIHSSRFSPDNLFLKSSSEKITGKSKKKTGLDSTCKCNSQT